MAIPLLVILGPTATGKTDLALALAREVDMEIISADSAMVYRMLDIGTAKPTPAQRREVPHHLIDIRDPDEDFTVADFRTLATAAVAGIHERGRLPVLVGGTGFYIRSLTRGLPFPPVQPNWELRRSLAALAAEKGNAYLHGRLAAADPAAAARIHPNDLQRIIRALEISHHRQQGGEDDSPQPPPEPPYQLVQIGLTMEREALYRRINQRSDEQLAAGWLDEVRAVLAAGYAPDCFGLQILGYRHLTRCLQGELSFEEAVRQLKRDTRHFARRQFTWFRREEGVVWFDVGRMTKEQLLEKVLQRAAGELPLPSK